MNVRNLVFLVGLFPLTAFSQTRVAVLPIRDQTRKVDVADVTEKLRRSVNNTPGFWTYPPDQLKMNTERFGLKPEQLYDSKNQRDFADILRINYYLEGRIRFAQKFILQVGLRDAKTGSLSTLKEYAFSGQFTQLLADAVAKDLLGKAPKAAPPVASTAPKKEAASKPSRAAQEPTPRRRAPEREPSEEGGFLHDRLRLWLDFPLLANDYKLTTTNASGDINSSGSFFPNFGFGVEGFIIPYVGLRGGFTMGLLSLSIGNASGGTTSIGAKLFQYGGDVIGRYPWKVGSRTIDLRALGGYHILNYSVDPHPQLTSNTYKGPYLGAGARIPLVKIMEGDLGLAFEGGFRPMVSVSESPVQTGTSASSKGYGFEGSLYWFFWRGFYGEAGYSYLKYSTTFSGTPTRSVAPDSKTSDLFKGILVRVGWKS